jgi:tRNA(Ile)-lysidine synthase
VGVSGGVDSLALLILADRWARNRRGRVTALTVDHRLRAGSSDEAAAVARLCQARGIAHDILVLPAPAGDANVEAVARERRYEALDEWCGAHGCLHLLTAHHREDQAETLLLRLARGSGVDGLSGMAPVRELARCRILRPLLRVTRTRLRARLAAEHVEPLADDPTNRDERFARARVRRAGAVLAAEGLTPERLSRTAERLAEARAALENAAAELLARSVALDPAGHAWLDPAALEAAPRDTGLRALSRVLATVSGSAYPPRYERLVAAYEGLARARTIGGCRVVPVKGRVLVVREPAAAAVPVPVPPGARVLWDGRFVVALAGEAPAGIMVGALGREAVPDDLHRRVPFQARAALPALREQGRLVAVPPLGFFSPGWRSERLVTAFFLAPARPLASAGFTVV